MSEDKSKSMKKTVNSYAKLYKKILRSEATISKKTLFVLKKGCESSNNLKKKLSTFSLLSLLLKKSIPETMSLGFFFNTLQLDFTKIYLTQNVTEMETDFVKKITEIKIQGKNNSLKIFSCSKNFRDKTITQFSLEQLEFLCDLGRYEDLPDPDENLIWVVISDKKILQKQNCLEEQPYSFFKKIKNKGKINEMKKIKVSCEKKNLSPFTAQKPEIRRRKVLDSKIETRDSKKCNLSKFLKRGNKRRNGVMEKRKIGNSFQISTKCSPSPNHIKRRVFSKKNSPIRRRLKSMGNSDKAEKRRKTQNWIFNSSSKKNKKQKFRINIKKKKSTRVRGKSLPKKSERITRNFDDKEKTFDGFHQSIQTEMPLKKNVEMENDLYELKTLYKRLSDIKKGKIKGNPFKVQILEIKASALVKQIKRRHIIMQQEEDKRPFMVSEDNF